MPPTFLTSLNATAIPSSPEEPSIIELYHTHPELMLGPWLVGAMLDVLLQGMLISQFMYYFRTFGPREGWRSYVRQLVVTVGVLSLLKSVQSFVIVYRKFVVGFANFDAAITHEFVDLTEPLFTAIIGFIVQGFFAYRCWLLMHRNWYILGILIILMSIGLAGAFGLTVMLTENRSAADQANFDTTVILSLAGALGCDLMITIITFVQLTRTRTGLRHMDTLPDRLVRLLWETALPSTVCATLNMVLYVTMAEYNFVFIAFNILLAKLYALALMMTINSRQMLRTTSVEKHLIAALDSADPSGGEKDIPRPLTLGRAFFPPPPARSPATGASSAGFYATLPTLTTHISVRSSWASNPPPFPPPRDPLPPVPSPSPLSIRKKSSNPRFSVPPPLEIRLPAPPSSLRIATRSIIHDSSPIREGSDVEKTIVMPPSFEPGLLAWAAEVDDQQHNLPLSPTPSSAYACSVDFHRLTADLSTTMRSPSADSHMPNFVTSPSSAALSEGFNKDLPTIPRASTAL